MNQYIDAIINSKKTDMDTLVKAGVLPNVNVDTANSTNVDSSKEK